MGDSDIFVKEAWSGFQSMW